MSQYAGQAVALVIAGMWVHVHASSMCAHSELHTYIMYAVQNEHTYIYMYIG